MLTKALLERLYVRDRKSLQEISDRFGCSVNRVHYWLKKYEVPVRSRSEALYVKYNPAGDPFALKKKMTRSDLVLLGLGLGLWWGEGHKRHQKAVRLGNTDPRLVKAFIGFLTVICGVKKEKLRFGLQIFSDMEPRRVKRWWLKHLGVRSDRFLPKTVVTPSRGAGTYREKTKYGVLTVYCFNVKLRKALDFLLERHCKHPGSSS